MPLDEIKYVPLDKVKYAQVNKRLKECFPNFSGIVAAAFMNNHPPVWDEYGNAKVEQFKDVEGLYGMEGENIIYHKNHEKFGKNVVELSHAWIKNNGAYFFDWKKLDELYQILVMGDATGELPHISFYYAVPEDRDDYKHGHVEWEEDD